MEQLKILIVEDNSLIAFELKTNVEAMGHLVVDTASTANGAKLMVDNNDVDLVLLDINLKGEDDGIEVARYLETLDIPFIYLTSYYDQNTLDRVKDTRFSAFIPKPYTELDLKLNIELAHSKRRMNRKANESKRDFYVYQENKLNKKIHYEDILYIKSDDNYSVFHTGDRKILVRIPLKLLPGELDDPRFFRIHRSYIINMDKIQSFSNNTVIIDRESLPISNSHRKDFKSELKKYWGT